MNLCFGIYFILSHTILSRIYL
jgi:hypothetical protein